MGGAACGWLRRRGMRCCGGSPLYHAFASLACAVAAVALFDSQWLDGAHRIAVSGALLTTSLILAFSAMLSEALHAPSCGSGGSRATAAKPSSAGRTTRHTATPALATAFTVLAVLAVSAAAASTFAAITAPSQSMSGHPGILDAMAACHSTEAGCGRAAIAGEGAQAHIMAPPPVITTIGVPATVSVSGALPPDARPPARVAIVVEGPDGDTTEHTTMSTSAGRYSLHIPIDPPSVPGTHEYTIVASYASRDLGFAVDVGTVPFTVMVLQPDVSRSEAPEGPPAWLEATGARPAGFPLGDGAGDGGGSGGAGGLPAAPTSIVDGIVSFDPPLPPAAVSAGQVVQVHFTYADGVPRESYAHVRGPAPDRERLAEPGYAGSGGHTPADAGSYTFIVQPTWQPGEYGVVATFGADGARDATEATTVAGILPVNVAAQPVNGTAPPFACVAVFGGGDSEVRHGRASGCYAGTVRGVLGPDTLDIDGRPVTLTVSNARGGGEADSDPSSPSAAAAERLRELCPAGSVALVDRDDTLAVDSREPHPTIRAGYYSSVWCLGPDGDPYGDPYGGHGIEPVNSILMAGGLASPDPVGCLSSERRLEFAECGAYTAVEQAVGGAVSAAIDAVSSAAGGSGEGDPGGDPGGDCAIAAVSYGTPLAPDVQSLREWRDLAMPDGADAFAGPALHAYYAVSPALADMLRDSPQARGAAAAALSVPVAIASAAVATAAPHAEVLSE